MPDIHSGNRISNTYYTLLSVENDEHGIINQPGRNSESDDFKTDSPQLWTEGFSFLYIRSTAIIMQNNEMMHTLPETCLFLSPGYGLRLEPHESQLSYSRMRFIPSHPDILTQLGLPVNQVFMPLKTDFILPTLKEMETELISGRLHCSQYISSIIALLFIKLAREVSESLPNTQGNYISGLRESFRSFRRKLYQNPEFDWNISNMSAEVSLGMTRFTSLYGGFYGITPRQDLILARVSRAKRLLENSGAKISLIAEMAGYTNVSYFISQFRSVESVPPGKYRKDFLKGV